MNSIATTYRSSGLNILPAFKSTKRPAFPWRRYQTEIFQGKFETDALCVVCGAISGNLEIIDFDYRAHSFDAFCHALSPEMQARLQDCLIESSQSGGLHLAYRCAEPVERNSKLCEVRLPDNGEDETIFEGKRVARSQEGFVVCTIETRGEKGIAIIAPTPGYDVKQGDWTDLPTLTKAERDSFIEAACSLTQITRTPVVRVPSVMRDYQKSDFDVANYLRETDATKRILIKNGWTYVCDYNLEKEAWRRPGKSAGISATVDKQTGMLYCFTSSTQLQQNATYTPLQLVATLEYNGDEKEASRDVLRSAQGYQAAIWDSQPVRQSPFTFEPKKEIAPIVDPSDVPFPDELLHPGGLLEDMMNLTRALSTKWQPRLAFVSALAGLSYLVARKVYCTETRVSPCVYALGISLPGTGKDAGRQAQRKLLNDDLGVGVHDSFESVQALQNVILTNKKAFLLQDEFGGFLESIANDRNPNRQRITQEFLTLFSSYAEEYYTAKTTASEPKGGVKLKASFPALSIYGMTNPSDFSYSLTERFLKNGLVARFLFVWGDRNPEWIDREAGDVPKQLKEIVAEWQKQPLNCEKPDVAIITADTPETMALFKSFENELYAITTEITNRNESTLELQLNFLNRIVEKARKYAGLFACSRNSETYNRSDVEKALSLARYEMKLFDVLLKNVFASNDNERNLNLVKAWIATVGDEFTQRDLTRKFRRLRNDERENILHTLVEMEILTCETLDRIAKNGSKCGTKKIYHVDREKLNEN